MKNFIRDFVQRGMFICGGGPIILAVVYAILHKCGMVQTLTVNEVVLGILTSALLAFIAGGINAIYKIEKLPLIVAILIHAVVLYIDYIIIYLANDWMKSELVPLIVFTVCFIVGFVIIWGIVYFTTKKSADRLNEKLLQHQRESVEIVME